MSASDILGWLLESGWQGAVMAAAILIILSLGRHRIPAAWKYGLLMLIAARFLLPSLPQSPFSAYRVVPASPSQAWERVWPETPVPQVLIINAAPVEVVAPEKVEAAVGVMRKEINWSLVAFGIWGLGAVTATLWLVTRQVIFTRRFARLKTAPSDEILEWAKAAAREAGLHRAPPVWLMKGIGSPALIGLWRPILMLPQGIELNRERLHLILLHECLHLKRADPWTHAASLLAWTLHWWNPVAWWLIGRLRVERELATDAAVLSRLNPHEQQAYGEILLGLAEDDGLRGEMISPALGILERHRDLKRRILQISAFARTPLIWSLIGALLVGIVAAFLLSKQATPVVQPLPTDSDALHQVIRDFEKAVETGDLPQVTSYLDRGLDVDSTDAVYVAATAQNLKMVRFLLSRGANPDKKLSWGDTPVGRACFLGNKKIADTLIAAGATIDPVIYASGTGDLATFQKWDAEKPLASGPLQNAIWHAAAANHRELFDWLWEKRKASGQTSAQREALLESCYEIVAFWGEVEMLERLEELGVDVQKVGPAALNKAVSRNRLAAVAHILDREARPQKSPISLRSAIDGGDLEMVKLLLDHGADINEQDGQQLTAISWAATAGKDDICAFLIGRGADLERKDFEGETAIWRAAFGGNSPETVKKLLDKGANIKGVNKQGETILQAMQGYGPPSTEHLSWPGKIYSVDEIQVQYEKTKKVVKLLLDAGADTAGNEKGEAPFLIAVQRNHPEIAEVLIGHGADVRQKTKDGLSLLASALSQGTTYDMVKLLVDQGADIHTAYSIKTTPPTPPISLLELALGNAATYHDSPRQMDDMRKTIVLLLNKGAQFNVQGDSRGNTWLAAAAHGDLPTLQKLKADGVEIDTSSANGWTALSISAALANQAMTDWLVQQGASVKKGAQHYSLLSLATNNDDQSLIHKILAAGVKPDSGAMNIAAKNNDQELFKTFVEAGGDASQVWMDAVLRNGNADILKIMLEKGAKPDAFPNYAANDADVFKAVRYKQPACLKLLLQYGANPKGIDSYNEDNSPLVEAKRSHPEFVPILEAAIKDWDTRHPPLDLEQEIARADAIFTTSFIPDKTPKLQVEKTLFQSPAKWRDTPAASGDEALKQGSGYLLNCYESSSRPQKDSRNDLVFSRMPTGNYVCPVPFALLSTYRLDGDTFTVAGKKYKLADLQSLLKDKPQPAAGSPTPAVVSATPEPLPKSGEAYQQFVQDFFTAAREGNIEKVKDYLDRGLDVNVSSHGNTAMLSAANYQQLAMVRYLLSRGSKPNFMDRPGKSPPLDQACMFGDKEIADALIAAGATTDPLIYAAGTGDVATFEKVDAKKSITGMDFDRAFRIASVANQPQVVDWLWEKSKRVGETDAQRERYLEIYYAMVAGYGKVDMLKHYEKLGVDFKKVSAAALSSAIAWKKTPTVAYLLNHEAPLQKNSQKSSVLLSSIYSGNLEMVRLLLDHGVDVNESGSSALISAAGQGREDIFTLLIDRGARIDAKDENGRNALWSAAFAGRSPEIVKKLLDKGADPKGLDKQGQSILSAMQRFVPPSTVREGYPGKILTKDEFVEQQTKIKRVVKLLVDAGADMNAAGYDGTPLMAALKYNHPDVAEALIEKGADIQQKDKNGNTPLSMAFAGGWNSGVSYSLVKLLLDKGADVNATFVAAYESLPPKTPMPILDQALNLASSHHEEPGIMREIREVIALVLSRGGQYKVEGDRRGAVWLAAAAKGDLNALKKLKGEGVDINTADTIGWTALTASLALDNQPVTDWLVQQRASLMTGPKDRAPLYVASRDGKIAFVRQILAAGAKPDLASLLATVSKGNLELFKILIAAGGDPAKIPVYIPVRYGYVEILKIMLEKGANPDSHSNFEDRSDVYWAVNYNQPECLKLLLQFGANPNIKTAYNETPLDLAKGRSPQMVPILEAAIKDWNIHHPPLTLQEEVAKADAILTTSFVESREPKVQVGEVFFKSNTKQKASDPEESTLGEKALIQASNVMSTRYRQIGGPQRDVVFSRQPEKDSFSSYAIVANYPITGDTFTVVGKKYTLTDLQSLLKSKSQPAAVGKPTPAN